MKFDLKQLAKRCILVCKKKKWRRHWTEGGCYLHLEVSELIESIRGKGDSTSTEEAADVMFVFLALCEEHRIPLDDVFENLENQLKGHGE